MFTAEAGTVPTTTAAELTAVETPAAPGTGAVAGDKPLRARRAVASAWGDSVVGGMDVAAVVAGLEAWQPLSTAVTPDPITKPIAVRRGSGFIRRRIVAKTGS